MKLKEIAWGLAGDTSGKICIYANGHLPIADFLEAVKSFNSSDVPAESRCALTESDVRHTRFRPMSPSEARSMGYDYGVMEADEEMHRGYPVTEVLV